MNIQVQKMMTNVFKLAFQNPTYFKYSELNLVSVHSPFVFGRYTRFFLSYAVQVSKGAPGS